MVLQGVEEVGGCDLGAGVILTMHNTGMLFVS